MFGKIFKQIFSSSIANDLFVRIVFQDMIVLADSDGIVDATPEYIASVTRVPLEEVKRAINVLTSPDPQSRTKDFGGARLVKIDPERTWGWKIVNYSKYREFRCENDRKEYMRNYMQKRRQREKEASVNNVNFCKPPLAEGDPSPSPSGSSLDQDRVIGEGANEVPTIEQAITQCMTMCIPEDFVRLVYSKWYERDGRDGSGNIVPWMRHVKGRWEREQSAWKNGTHTGLRYSSKSGSGNGKQEKIPLFRQVELLKEAISAHPSNPGSRAYRQNTTDQQKKELSDMKVKLKQLTAEMTKSVIHGNVS